MTDAKTMPSAVDPADFIAGVEPAAKRKDAEVLDVLFRKVTGEQPKMWGPSIVGYGEYCTTYASGRDVRWMRTGFSPRKAKHSIYLMGGYCDEQTGKRRDEHLMRLGKHSRGKSCLYINKLADVNLTVLETMMVEDWAAMQRVYPPE